MKKILRITEEDLNNIIKEGVNKVLSELDWRTYHNAANKDYDRKRARKFADMRDKKFNDEYEYNDSPKGNFMRMQGGIENPTLEILSNNNSREAKHYIKHPEDDKYGFYVNNSSGYDKYPNADGDKRFARNIAKAHDAFNNINAKYENGKYQDNDTKTDFHKFLGKK